MQAELVQRGPEVNQPLLVGGHAGFERRAFAVLDGFARLANRGVLQEILFQPGIGWSEGHRGRSVAVVNHVVGWKEETRAVPRPPLVVGVDGSHTHEHRGSVHQR